ncbi:ATP-binding protein [uncultured Deinococcus sp.]|uniref:GAF domain-containing sensor histidine kinase n=1 Tax=uncultured Deinococcus sp. TaxID=158789 RepID=UPI0025ED9EC7|nr:ATP-binding protein [uncultured Deinococcus sp.]
MTEPASGREDVKKQTVAGQRLTAQHRANLPTQLATAHAAWFAPILWGMSEAGASDLDRLQVLLAQRTFLLNFNDAVRPLADPVEIQTTAIRVLGEHLGANRVLYFEIHGTDYVVEHNYIHGAVALTGAFPVDSFSPQVLEAQHAGRTVAVCDVAADPDLAPERKAAYAAIGVGALADVSLVKNGEFIAGLAIHFSQPHVWTPEELTLCEDVAERTWGAVERARSESALRESEDKFRTLFNSIDEGFCIVEILFSPSGEPVDYRFVQANPAFAELTGLPTDALGKTARELVPDLEAFWVETYGGVARTGNAVRFENRSEPMNRWFDVYATRVGGAGSTQVAIVFNNISERKQAEADIKELNRLLEARIEERTRTLADERAALEVSNDELQAFNYSVSHDLMTPLRHIAGFAQLASRNLHDPEKTRRYLQIIVEGAQRMETLIEAMLALSRTGQRELSVGAVDLNDLLRQAQLDVAAQLGGRTVEWRLRQLPVVRGDRVTLQQVMTNLLENASKYSENRDPAVIEVWADEDAQQWTVFVRDNGAGFDPAYAGKLFGIFQRLHHQDEFKGTGVGLSLVRRIITRHGGTVGATGGVDQGATFWFTLPRPERTSTSG